MWKKVIEATIKYYERKISELQEKIDNTKDSAAKSPGSMQSWSDKSKDEFTQMASALSKNLEPLQFSLKQMESILKSQNTSKGIIVGSIVKTQEPGEDNNEYLLIVPGVGGDTLNLDDKEYFLLSAESELGKQLLNKKLNDKLKLKSGSEVLIVEIINN